MRILDLGSHDGYISSWIGRQRPDTHIDGVELNEQAVAIASERSARYGIPGEFKIGLAEDAADLFDPGTYDAVIAFELIEHVPDVDRFLDAIERMCKPGGRVYLSTPDGTFGAGQNPHHLRVYRAIDLNEIIRARGLIHDIRVGPDGVTFAAYEPQVGMGARGDLAIYTGPAYKQWSPHSIELPGGLGGSETAAVKLAAALSEIGYRVTVYGECAAGAFGQVIFRHHESFDPMVERAAVISSRSPHLFDRPINSAAKVLWMHDTDYGAMLTEERAVDADAVMVLSRWHEDHVLSCYPFLEGRTRITANAIEPKYFAGARRDRNPHRAIFTSSPDRGLDFLLELWPKVREALPDAELAFCYADVYAAAAAVRPEVGAHAEKVAKLADQPGAVNLGHLSQPDLAREMARAGVWLHPSWTSYAGESGAPFNETYCIGAVEAAAAGCRLIASNWGALPERALTAKKVRLIPATPGGVILSQQWVEAIVGGMAAEAKNPTARSPRALATTWDKVAGDFDDAIMQAQAPMSMHELARAMGDER